MDRDRIQKEMVAAALAHLESKGCEVDPTPVYLVMNPGGNSGGHLNAGQVIEAAKENGWDGVF